MLLRDKDQDLNRELLEEKRLVVLAERLICALESLGRSLDRQNSQESEDFSSGRTLARLSLSRKTASPIEAEISGL